MRASTDAFGRMALELEFCTRTVIGTAGLPNPVTKEQLSLLRADLESRGTVERVTGGGRHTAVVVIFWSRENLLLQESEMLEVQRRSNGRLPGERAQVKYAKCQGFYPAKFRGPRVGNCCCRKKCLQA